MKWPLLFERKSSDASTNASIVRNLRKSHGEIRREGVKVQCREIWLPFRPISKARPRFSGHAYTDKVYAQWKGDVRSFLAEWWTDAPLDRLNVLVAHFYGPARGDLDNRVGSVLDAAKGVLFTDDAVTVIPALVLKHIKVPAKEARIYLMLVWEEEQ
jgi:hypothetical protein